MVCHIRKKIDNENPAYIERIINDNKEIYNIGLHGPDILFYYHPLYMNKINTIGYEMHGLMVNFEANQSCEDSTKKLFQLYDVALERAVKLIIEYDKYLLGKHNLNSIYNYTFGGKDTQIKE